MCNLPDNIDVYKRQTHRMAGRLWFAAGLLMMLLSVLPKEILTGSILGIALAMALAPYIYSVSYTHLSVLPYPSLRFLYPNPNLTYSL